jgi:hypothetical protein
LNLFRPNTVARILAQHDQRVRNHETAIWALLIFVMWHDQYIRTGSLSAAG